MPISKEKKKLYPYEWPQIRGRILERAGHRCDVCGVKNYSVGTRAGDGTFQHWGQATSYAEGRRLIAEAMAHTNQKHIVIVLTIAHLDHDPTNSDEARLKAMCQLCHLTYDRYYHSINARETWRRKRGTLVRITVAKEASYVE